MASKFQEIGNGKGDGKGELSGPQDVAVDKDGNIAVLENGNNRVQVFDGKTGQSLRCFPVDGYNPWGLEIDANGQFFVTSGSTGTADSEPAIRVYSREGKLTQIRNPDSLGDPRGVAVLKDGRMVVVDGYWQQSCLLLQPDGSLIRKFDKFPPQDQRSRFFPRDPLFTAVDELRGRLFVTDSMGNKVCVFGLEGELKSVTIIGQNPEECRSPKGITLDPAGNIIVSSHDPDPDRRLLVFSAEGKYLRSVATTQRLPWGIALTPNGYLAVACRGENCIELHKYQ